MSQHRAYESIKGPPLTQFMARSLGQLTDHKPDWWQCFVVSTLGDGVPASAVDELEVQQIASVFLRHSARTTQRKYVRLFDRHEAKTTLLDYLHHVQNVRHKAAHQNYVSAQEQLADLILCGRLVDEMAELRGHLPTQDAQLVEAVKRPIPTYLRSLASDGAETQDADQSLFAEDMKKMVRTLTEAVVELKADIMKQRSGTAPPAGIPAMPGSPVLASSLAQLEERATLQARAIETVIERLDRTGESINALIASNADVAGRLSAMATLASTLEAVRETVSSTSRAVDDIQDAAAAEDEADAAPVRPRALTSDEVRDQFIALRGEVWEACRTGPSRTGMLRKNMLDLFIENRITNDRSLRKTVPPSMLAGIDPRELQYLPQVFEIVSRML